MIYTLLSDLNVLKNFNNDLVKKIIFNVENCLNYINRKKLRFTFIGKQFSGKSAILNSFIGNKILPLHEINQNSNINLIIRCKCNNDKKIELFKAKMIFIENYCFFEEDNEAIATEEDVKIKLIELKSNEIDFENSFYILKTPIKAFQFIESKNEIIKNIEIIYLSGKYIENLAFGINKNMEALIKYSNSFIYIENERNISKENFLFLKKVIFFLSTINNSFNLEKFLYVINKTSQDNISVNIINNIINYLPKICWFSLKEYEKFMEIKTLVENDKQFFAQVIKQKIKEKGKINLIDEISKELSSLKKFKTNNIVNLFRKIFIKGFLSYLLDKPEHIMQNLYSLLKKEGISENELKENAHKIEKLADNFLDIQSHIYDHITYFDSNAEIFFSEIYNLIFDTKYYLDYNLKITTENIKDYLKSILELIYNKISEDDEHNLKYFFLVNNEEKILINKFEIYFKEYKQSFLERVELYKNKYISKINDIYNKKSDKTNNVDKLMENEEVVYFDTILENLSKYSNSYDKFKENNKLNDIFIHSNIYLKDYDRSIINKDSIKTEFKFGWFFYYSIKNKINNKFLIPKSINYLYKDKNLKQNEYLNFYEFKFKGFKYFINNILQDIYSEMKNNINQIIDFKKESFIEIKNNINQFIEAYINVFDSFDQEKLDGNDEDLKDEIHY